MHLLDRPHWATPCALEVAPPPRFTVGHDAGIGFRRHSDGWSFSPLEIGLQAIQLWPYHAGLAVHRHGRLWQAAALQACYCPLALSRPGKPLTQECSSKFLPAEPGIRRSASRRTQGMTVSHHPALQWSLSDRRGSPPDVDVLVAGTADHEGLTPSLGHEVHPCGSLRSAGSV